LTPHVSTKGILRGEASRFKKCELSSGQHIVFLLGRVKRVRRSYEALELLQVLGQLSVFVEIFNLATKPDIFSTVGLGSSWRK